MRCRVARARQAREGPASDHIYGSPGTLFTLFQCIPAFKTPDGISQKGFLVSSNPGSESMPGDRVLRDSFTIQRARVGLLRLLGSTAILDMLLA